MFRRNGLGQTLKEPVEVGAIMVGNSDPLTWLDPTRWLSRGEAGANEQTEGPILLPHPTHTHTRAPNPAVLAETSLTTWKRHQYLTTP